jgi:LPXTG-motif cell wall-anchored protein
MSKAMKLFSAITGAVVLLGLGSALAQSYPPSGEPAAAPPATFVGTVVSHEGMTLVVKSDDGREMTFTHDSSLSLPWNIKPGDRVSVEYTSDSNGYQAVGVAAAPASATASAGSSAEEESLPQTASPLPLLALMGTALLGTGAVIWYRARRAA